MKFRAFFIIFPLIKLLGFDIYFLGLHWIDVRLISKKFLALFRDGKKAEFVVLAVYYYHLRHVQCKSSLVRHLFEYLTKEERPLYRLQKQWT